MMSLFLYQNNKIFYSNNKFIYQNNKIFLEYEVLSQKHVASRRWCMLTKWTLRQDVCI